MTSLTDLDALVARLNRRLPDRSRRPFKSNATVPLNPDGPEAASAIERLKQALETAESEARRYAEYYPPASDGRNTFVILADRIAALSSEKAGSQ